MIISSKRRILIYSNSILLASTLLFSSCKTHYGVESVSAKNIVIDESIVENNAILEYIAPYKAHVDKEMNQVLSYAPETLDKSKGKWETTIGNLFAQAVMDEASPVFKSRTGKTIDMCLLNYGGIRAVINQGDVTTRTAFEVMPFENSAIVLEIKGSTIQKLAEFYIKNKTAHPLLGMNITIDKNQEIKNITINNQPLDLNKTYHLVTNDYLALGGDNMSFLLEAISATDIDYKLRNILIAYFNKHPQLPIITKNYIIEE